MENVFRDYQSHYLRCSLANRHQSRVSPMAVNIKLVSVAIASIDLNCLVANLERVLCRENFALCSLRLEGFSLTLQMCGSVDHHSSRVYHCQHVRKLGLSHFEFG